MKNLLENFHQAILDNNVAPILPAIKQNPRISEKDQMAIYIDGYRIRLVQAIKSDYPALIEFIGETEFEKLASQYIESTPPSNYNLDKYPINFSSSLKNYPDDFVHSIAILESAIAEVFIMPESKPIKPEEFSGNAILKPRAASKLLKFKYNVNNWLTGQREGKNPPKPEAQQSFLYVYRHNNSVQRYQLDEAAYLLLTRIFSGITLEAALEATVNDNPQLEETIASNLQDWFRDWVMKAIFTKQTAPPPLKKQNTEAIHLT